MNVRGNRFPQTLFTGVSPLDPRQMNDRINTPQRLVKVGGLRQIVQEEIHPFGDNRGILRRTSAQGDDRIPSSKMPDEMAADSSSRAGDENPHASTLGNRPRTKSRTDSSIGVGAFRGVPNSVSVLRIISTI